MIDGTDPNATPPAGTTTEQPPQKTDEELADTLYDPKLSYGPALKGDLDKMRDVVGLSEQEATEEIAAASQFFSDARIPIPEARTLHGLFVHHLDQPADEATRKQWTVESRRQLRETYGRDADSRLTAVKDFLGRYPGIRDHLEESGLGKHPRIVMALAEQARKFRPKGK